MKKFLLAVLALTLSLTGAVLAQAPATPDKTTSAPEKSPDKSQDNTVNGKWHFVFNTPGGDRDFDADFTVDAEGKVSGTFGKSAAAGTYKDGHLQMAFDTTTEEGETGQLQMDGKLDEIATLTGTWSFSSYDGTFKATRPKP
jgi:hypothetical protein